MAEMRTEYNETMEYIISRGLWGPVEDIDHDYQKLSVCKNEILNPKMDTASKTKNEEPAVIPLSGGFSLLFKEVA